MGYATWKSRSYCLSAMTRQATTGAGLTRLWPGCKDAGGCSGTIDCSQSWVGAIRNVAGKCEEERVQILLSVRVTQGFEDTHLVSGSVLGGLGKVVHGC